MFINNEKPRAMVCPLNWGLGHASRCVPIIRKLQLAGYEVIVAADGRAQTFLHEECSEIKQVNLPGFSPKFSSKGTQVYKFPGWVLSLAWNTIKEHYILSRLIDKYSINLVISDNRYGLFSKKTKCIFVTHQVMFKAPLYLKFTEPLLYRINRFMINKFDACWIPDLPGDKNLSGDLAHKYPLPKNAGYIGILSRFKQPKPNSSTAKCNILALVSGPEPQRSIFEGLIIREVSKTNQLAIIVRGTPGERNEPETTPNINIYNHLSTKILAGIILEAETVICRSGYSSLMDMAVLGKISVILVPTPGQTEQEYLAKHMKESGWFKYQNQNSIDMFEIGDDKEQYSGINLNIDESLLDTQIEALYSNL
jgi:uncharacterized protein (TIGR00661 family)